MKRYGVMAGLGVGLAMAALSLGYSSVSEGGASVPPLKPQAASTGSDFERMLLASPEVMLGRRLGVNTVTLQGNKMVVTQVGGLQGQGMQALSVNEVRGKLQQLGMSTQQAAALQEVEVRPAALNAQALSAVAAKVAQVLDQVERTVSVDFVESKVAINIAPEHQQVAREQLKRSGVQLELLRFGPAPDLQPLSGGGTTDPNVQYINGRVTPSGGGALTLSSGLPCSQGWLGSNGRDIYLMTAAHCYIPSSDLNLYQAVVAPDTLLGKTTETRRSGLDVVPFLVSNTNLMPEALVADDWSGKILSREKQAGGAFMPSSAWQVKLSGSTSFRREWNWGSDFTRIVAQDQKVFHKSSGMLINTPEYCIVMPYNRASDKTIHGTAQGGDSSGILMNEKSEVLGTMSVVGTFDTSLPMDRWEWANCFVGVDQAQALYGITPIHYDNLKAQYLNSLGGEE